MNAKLAKRLKGIINNLIARITIYLARGNGKLCSREYFGLRFYYRER